MKLSNSTDLTTSEVANILRVSATSIRDWANMGILKSTKTLGGHRRYELESVEQFASDKMGKLLKQNDPLKVLIIDDDRDFCEYLSDFVLNKVDNSYVEYVCEGFVLGKKIKSFKPSVILVDINLPQLNGIEICHHIKMDAKEERMKIFVMSGDDCEENRRRALALGADSFINKPVNTNVLLYLLGQVYTEK